MNPWLIAVPMVVMIVEAVVVLWLVCAVKEANEEARCWRNSCDTECDRVRKLHAQLQSAESKLRKISRIVQSPESKP